MKTILHKASSRGSFDYGWLKTNYSFSFSSWHNLEKIHFGAIRVFNDDIISGGMGFDTHSHDNMEIITIPTSGQLEHKDSMGNHGIVSKGEVQVMSAGSGIQHSEFNNSKLDPVSLFQIWLFPNKKNVQPRYDQKAFDFENLKNKFIVIVSPIGESEGLNIHQNAWFSIGKMDTDFIYNYELKQKTNGLYLFVIEGEVNINGEIIGRRDALAISETSSIEITANRATELLLMEIPV